MAVSGSNDFEQTEESIIKDALILCGGLEDDETPSDAQKAYARRALNRMIKAWSVKGLKAWCWNEVALTLVVSQQSYSIGQSGADLTTERPIKISNVRKVVSGDETPVRIMSRQEYMNQPGKDDTGEIVAVYYDPQLTNGVLYVWPAPSAANTLKFSLQQYIEDFDANANTPYFPVEWHEALIYGLALRLCPKYEVLGERLQLIAAQAESYLYDAEAADMEQGSLYIAPEVWQ